ncbi:MAG: aldo/keto reductase [Gammaproteobacteria bacterium]|nr:aldo/keto reductase [Gammaproteobacteria bacterium]
MMLNRRQFLQYISAVASGLAIGPCFGSVTLPQHRRVIPTTGESIPAIGLGSWLTFGIDPDNRADMKVRQQILSEFLKAGGGLLDSSPMYGNAERVIGLCLNQIGQSRHLFSATKVWTHGTRGGVMQMEESRLLWGLPRLDLIQVHNLLDWESHLPTLYAMKQQGLIRYVGVTTSHGRRHKELIKIMRTQTLDFVQFTYNLLDREAEQYLLPMAQDRGIAVIINRPFQRGGLFKRVSNHPLPDWAKEIDCSNWAQFFLKFIISHPAVSCAIPATSRVDHLQQNLAAAYGRLPDNLMRSRMVRYVSSL